MKFTVPDSSDPPSTPDRSSRRDPIPSTTPLGPPPSASKSIFSQDASRTQGGNAVAKGLFRSVTQKSPMSQQQQQQPQRGRSFGNIPSSPPPEAMDDTAMTDDNQDSLLGISPGVNDSAMLRSSFLTGALTAGQGQNSGDRSPKRQRIANNQLGTRGPSPVDVKAYARGVVASSGPLKLGGSDALIMGTENVLENLSVEVSNNENEEQIAALTSRELLKLWNKLYPIEADDVLSEEVGPSAGQPSAISASMLAHLLLPLHHPSAAETIFNQKGRAEQSLIPHGLRTSIPKILVDWLANYHEPGSDVIDAVNQSKGCFANDEAFWDAVMSSLIRGQLSRVITFLQGANFRKTTEINYTNPQLDYIDDAIQLMVELLSKSPAVQANDWDVKGGSWSLFRRQVVKAQEELREMLEGDDGDEQDIDRNQLSFALSQRSRAAESRLPQDIYDSLNDLCDMLRGDPYAVKNAAFDWLEAVVCLTIWWDGDDGDMNASQRASRRSLGASSRSLRKPAQTRPSDLTPALAYRQRLSNAFRMVIDEKDLADMIDWNNPFHVALCCIMECELESALSIVKNFSLTIASAVADIGTFAGWIAARHAKELDEQDLMVLSYAQQGDNIDVKDELLQKYAQLLAPRQVVEDKIAFPPTRAEGWDLALGVLSRMNNAALSSEHADKLVSGISLSSNGQVDSILEACAQYGFGKQADLVAVKYANELADSSQNYGDSLYYYSKGHDAQKLKELLHTLITFSLVQSSAFPLQSELDERLRKILKSPFKAVKELGTTDIEAARYLSTYLSGYATIRRFYECRDENLDKKQSTPTDDIDARKRAAAALIAAVSSASDSIRDGKYDASIDNVIPVDHLLVLFGESLVFFNRKPKHNTTALRRMTNAVPGSTLVFSYEQMTKLLKVVEDLDTVSPEIFSRCEALFRVAVANAHDESDSPFESLKKSISDLTSTSSQFSLINSSMLKSQILDSAPGIAASTESHDLMTQSSVQRAWDWRKGFGENSEPRDVVRILRLGLAKDLAREWVNPSREPQPFFEDGMAIDTVK